MIGAIVGDIVGSVYEFDNLRRTDFEPLFHPDSDFTDDTVCTIAVAAALLDGLDPAVMLLDWCRRYPGRGYGGRFADWLQRGDLKPYNSFGNGSAMRVAPAALLARTLEEAATLARQVTVVTHSHPEGVKGAVATAEAIFLARHGVDAAAIANRRQRAARPQVGTDQPPAGHRFSHVLVVEAVKAVAAASTCPPLRR